MTDDLNNLAREVVTLPAWRWLPGMLTQHGERVLDVAWRGTDWRMLVIDPTTGHDPDWVWASDGGPRRPDCAEAATLGCLLALVRAHHPGAHAEPNGAPKWDGVDEGERACWWAVFRPGGFGVATGPTEAHALVAALRGAP